MVLLLIFVLLLHVGITNATTTVAPEQITCQITRVLLASGDSMQFNVGMHLLPDGQSFAAPDDVDALSATSTAPAIQTIVPTNNPATTVLVTTNTTCHWIVVARSTETLDWDAIKTPTAIQIQKGIDSGSNAADMFGSFHGIDTIVSQSGVSADFGQLMFVVVTTSDVEHGTRVSLPRRLVMPRRCRYTHNSVVVPAGWSYKTNLTRNLADFGAASLPQSAPPFKNMDVSAAALASRLYISGGTYDSGKSWSDPLSGTFKAQGYWVDPLHSGRSFNYYPDTYLTSANMVMENIPSGSGGAGGSLFSTFGSGSGSSSSKTARAAPTLAFIQRRLFGMTGVMPDNDIRLLFHMGGINEIDGILNRTDVLRISKADGTDGYWDTLNEDWSLNIPRHSVASTSWTNPLTKQIHLYVIGGNTEDGATLNNIEMLIVPEPKYLKTEYIEVKPYQPFHLLNGTLLVPRSRASAVVVDNHLYVIGGELALLGEVERCNLLTGCHVFDLIAPLRKPRYAGSAIWSSEMKEILYIGGFRVGQYCNYNQECTDDAPTFVNLVAGPSNDVESYHIETDSWNPRAKLQVARYGLEVAEIIVPNEGYNDKSGDTDVYASVPMRPQIVAMGGVGGLVWGKETPMTPRRVSTVEIFSCYQYSSGKVLGVLGGSWVGLSMVMLWHVLF